MAINIPICQLMVGCFWLLWEFLRFYLFSHRISWGLTWRLQKESPISNSKIVSGSSNNIYYRKLLPPFFYVCGRLVHFWISRRQTFVNGGSTNLVLHCRTMMTKRRVVDRGKPDVGRRLEGAFMHQGSCMIEMVIHRASADERAHL